MSLLDERLRDILDSVGRRSPEMGGSTASTLCALIGLSMAKMAIVISASHASDEDYLLAAERRIDAISADLAAASDRDRQHFLNYMQTLRDETSATSGVDRHEAKEGAVRAPLSAAELIVESMDILASVDDCVEDMVASDLYGGAALLNAAFAGTMMAVETNLAGDSMTALRQQTESQRLQLSKLRDAAFSRIGKTAAGRGFRC